jgi:hypothetical protein
MQTARDLSHHFRYAVMLLAALLLCCFAAPVRLRPARAESCLNSLLRQLLHDWCGQMFKVVEKLHQKRSCEVEEPTRRSFEVILILMNMTSGAA